MANERNEEQAEFMRKIREKMSEGRSLSEGLIKQQSMAEIFGFSTATVNKALAGGTIERDFARMIADALEQPRDPFIRHFGYEPLAEDREHDRRHYGLIADSHPNERSNIEGNEAFDVIDSGKLASVGPDGLEEDAVDFREVFMPDEQESMIHVNVPVPGLAQPGDTVIVKKLPHYGNADYVLAVTPDGQMEAGAYGDLKQFQVLGEIDRMVFTKKIEKPQR